MDLWLSITVPSSRGSSACIRNGADNHFLRRLPSKYVTLALHFLCHIYVDHYLFVVLCNVHSVNAFVADPGKISRDRVHAYVRTAEAYVGECLPGMCIPAWLNYIHFYCTLLQWWQSHMLVPLFDDHARHWLLLQVDLRLRCMCVYYSLHPSKAKDKHERKMLVDCAVKISSLHHSPLMSLSRFTFNDLCSLCRNWPLRSQWWKLTFISTLLRVRFFTWTSLCRKVCEGVPLTSMVCAVFDFKKH